MNSIKPLTGRIVIVICAALGAASLKAQSSAASDRSTRNQTENDDQSVTYMSPFVVIDEGEEGYSGQHTLIGSRTAKNLLEIPANITVISKQLIDDLNAVDARHAIRFGVSGVTANTEGEGSADFNVRGFRIEQAMRDGVTKGVAKANEMYDISRIEVIKGPAAMLLGNNSYLGGAINLVSYQPTAARSSEIRATVGDHNYLRVSANTAGPLLKSEDTSINYRFTVGGLTGQPERKVEKLGDRFIGGAFAVNFGAKATLLVNLYYYYDKSYRYFGDFLIYPFTEHPQLNQYWYPGFSNAQQKDVKMNSLDEMINLTYLTKLSQNGNLRMFYACSNIREDRRGVLAYALGADGYSLARLDIPLKIYQVNHNFQMDYLHHLSRDSFTLDSAAGIDGSINYQQQIQSVNVLPDLDVRNPNWAADDAYFSQPHPSAGLPDQYNVTARTEGLSYYFQENLGVLKDRLIFVAGLRQYPKIQNYTTDNVTQKVTPSQPHDYLVHKYGVVFKLLPTVSVYYTDAANVYPSSGYADLDNPSDRLGGLIPDQEGKLKEVGLKADHKVSEKLSLYGTLAYFDTELTNVKTSGPLRSGKVGTIISLKDRSKGWELDLGARYKAGITTTDVIVTHFDGSSVSASTPGVQIYNFVPRKTSILAKVAWTDGPLNGWMVGGAVIEQSEKVEGTYRVDPPAIYTAFLGYEYNKHWGVQLNVDNLFDKRFVDVVATNGYAEVFEGRSIRLMVKYLW